MRPTHRPKIFYGWIIVGLSFVTLAFHITARFAFSIFQVPIIEEFGWGRGVLGAAYGLSLGVYAVSVPFMGALLERKGPRAVMPWGSVLLGAALVGGYFISALWHVFLLIGLLPGLAIALSGFATHSALMPRWFLKKRGRATGIALAGPGIGILLLSPLIERGIALWSWRHTYLLYGILLLFVLAPLNFLLLRNRPEEVGQARDGLPAGGATLPPAPAGGGDKRVWSTFLLVRHDGRFWGLVITALFIGLNNNTIFTQLQIYLVDAKFSMASAALVFGAVGFLRTLGSVTGGWLSDHIGRGRGQGVAAGFAAAGILLLMALPPLRGGMGFGMLFALVFGLGIGGMSACYSSLAGDCFEGPNFAVIMGFLEICYGLGGVVGPSFAGFMFDSTGSYLIPFSSIVLGLIATVFIGFWLQGLVGAHKAAAAG